MGTRADFYAGRGEAAEWLGSIAWDGYPDGIDDAVLSAASEPDYRAAVAAFFSDRDDVTRPDDGWPWPWDDSSTTDYAYAFDEGRVWASYFGHAWFLATDEEPEEESQKTAVFPTMKTDQHAPAGSHRSGIMVISLPAREDR